MTKWITSDDEVKSQIPVTDKSTKVVKTFEAQTKLPSILRLIWNVDTDSLIELKNNSKNCRNFVSAVFDPLGICLAFTIRMRFLLESIWAAMGQAWDNGTKSCQ